MLLSRLQTAFTLAFVLGLASVCLAAVLPQTDSLSIDSLGLHSSMATVGGMPSQGFEIKAAHWGPKLQPTSCLINAVNAMASMALQQIHELMKEMVFEMEEQPGVSITVLPANWHRGGQMPRKYAVWGLYLAVYTMTRKNNFQCNTIHLLWKHREVGTINFSRGVLWQSQTSQFESREGLLSIGNITPKVPSLAQPRNITGLLKTDPTLSIDIELLGAIIPVNNVFITVLGALMDVAHFDNKDAPVMAMIFDTMPVPTHLSFTTWDKPSKAEPPFMTNRHVIEALAYLPQYMYVERKFSEADITVKLDNIKCGLGLLRKYPGGVGQGAVNLTTA